MPRTSHFTICLLVIITQVLFIIFHFNFTPGGVPAPIPSRQSTLPKYILYWTPFWGFRDFLIGFGMEPFENCEYKNCFATNNRSLKPIEEFNAILFHGTIYNPKKNGRPQSRRKEQVYIFLNVEAPVYIAPNFAKFNSFYNWTMTYRFDSDIVWRHGKFIEEESNYTLPSAEAVQKKTKLIAWFASHCKTSSRRERLAAEMQKFLPVDIYGSCGPLKCGKSKNNSKLSSSKCYDMLDEDYKFYLSFENSICKDYSTEKLYNVLRKNVVPIVYGGGDYNLSAPPHSVIDVSNFHSVEELVEYLSHLDRNVTEYLKYFEWKKNYKVVKQDRACDICKKLHEPFPDSVYNDLTSWSFGTHGEICKTSKHLPEIVRQLL